MLRWFFEDLQQGLSGYSYGLWIENAWLTLSGMLQLVTFSALSSLS